MQEKTLSAQKLIVIITTFILVYLLFRFALPLLFPFLISGVIAVLLYPMFQRISSKTRLSSTLLGVVLLLLLLTVTLTSFYFLGKTLLSEVKILTEKLPIYKETFSHYISSFCCSLESITGMNGISLERTLEENITLWLSHAKTSIRSKIFVRSFSYIKVLLHIFTVCFLALISFILWIKDYKQLRQLLRSLGAYEFCQKFYKDMCTFFGTYLKTQLIILVITCIISVLGFVLLKNPYALLFGIGVGIMDALPFLGTGCVFLPCCIFAGFQANFFHAAVYLTLYLLTALSREFIEPKLLGKQFGIPSILILILIYAGIEIFGLAGVILGPLYALLCYEILSLFHTTFTKMP